MGPDGGPAPALRVDVPALLDGVRLDRAVAMLAGVTRARAAAMVAAGKVRLDGAEAGSGSRPVRSGSVLEVAPDEVPAALEPDASVPFAVVHEDDDLVVVDKPAGVVVHPGAGRPGGTLVNGLLARYPELEELVRSGTCPPLRPGIVHRLDRETSGLLAVARSARAYESLVEQLSARTADRRYVTLVRGHVPDDRGIVDVPIGRSDRQPTRMTVSAGGRDARTVYRVIERFESDQGAASLLSVELETGRTHQIRVHLAAIGHPVVGDRRYGRGQAPVLALPPGRLFLHAELLGLSHPADGRRMRFTSPLPPDLAGPLESLRRLDEPR